MFTLKKTLSLLVLVGILLSVGLVTAQAQTALPPPVPRHPINGIHVPTARPTFSWNPVPGAVRYHLQIATNRQMMHPIADLWTDHLGAAPITFMLAGPYYWRVEAISALNIVTGSPVQSFYYDLMQSPRPNTDVHSTTPRFTWNAHPQAQQYLLYIESRRSGLDPTVTTCIFTKHVLSSGPCGTNLPYGDYRWHVLVDVGSGFVYPVSLLSWWSLTVNPKVLAPGPTNLGPNGVLIFDRESAGDEIVLSFSIVPNAVTYEIQTSDNPRFDGIVSSVFAGPGDWDITIAHTNRVYWRVRAWLPGNITTAWSQTAWYEIRLE